ncbi:MAG TPA: c-type cytochrome [Kofleriaceae bacterium]|nr:c-type cytochrome [Kofleriaceae bacterium]
MRTHKLVLGVLAAAVPTSLAVAKAFPSFGVPELQLASRPLGGAQVASPTPAYLAGSRIMAVDDDALVIDADSGALLRTDALGRGTGELAIGRDAGLLTVDPVDRVAYVADRRNDRIAVVMIDKADRMTLASSIKTAVEPYGVALTPDRQTLLVTAIADRTLAAYDVASGVERWHTPLSSEPRGVAISPDGSRALVAYLTTGTVDEFRLDDAGMHRAAPIALGLATATAGVARRCRHCGNGGDSFARGAFAVTFLGEHQAVVPFQRETPVQSSPGTPESSGTYGGSTSEAPISHQLAFLGFGDGVVGQVTAQIAQHQPRALAWDRTHDALYVAGLGSDSVLQIRNASQASIALGGVFSLGERERCGPDGLAITPAGDVMVWCSFSRSVERVMAIDSEGAFAGAPKVGEGPSLIASAMTAKQHAGMVLFHAAEPRVSMRGALACASCHPDQRADGLSWRIDQHVLQTPVLAGRMVGTHPFKWDGTDATLRDSLTSTMKRLGGTGLSKRETDSLAAYLEALPSVRTPHRDASQVARGRKLFEAEGCAGCHFGASYTDQERHKFSGTLRQSDTPSLLGLAASAPYFHDGSASTLEVLLRDRGAVHGMADTARLSDQQVADLTAFLETL